jgi:hypothetical protein
MAERRLNVLEAGKSLGLQRDTAVRELDRIATHIIPTANALYENIEAENATLPDSLKSVFAGELYLLRAIRSIVIQDMTVKLQSTAVAA